MVPPATMKSLTEHALDERARLVFALCVQSLALNCEATHGCSEIFSQGNKPARDKVIAAERDTVLNELVVPAWV
jgi:hypothetical protein